ncbi:hypothetical protein GCM10010912_18970 [Paenibacillus albidus]|uniref:Uncharacterized protein n=1 Tax=Paenibacillus albidus TaxID=2041023 RepID=A0A917FFW5_9BACL|nr:hypothetical protein [Paenibacillus albidus]MBT2292876.1 hypothetical protein [Paenibacillus albidus]GGF73951.1 hypothetical protein GCM10010912_18970 [Paenibacillus albidus]
MELAFLKNKAGKLLAFFALLSMLCGLLALALINAALLSRSTQLLLPTPLVAAEVLFGLTGLAAPRTHRAFAWWGLGIALFIVLFNFVLFGLAWMINPRP